MIDLSSHVRLRLTGADRVRYLNGQVTNDVRKISPDSALWACVTNHKGRLEALVTLHAGPEPEGAIYVEGPEALRDFLPARLEKYIIADDVTLEDITEETSLLHVIGDLPELTGEFRAVACARFGVPGWDVWSDSQTTNSLSEGQDAPAPCSELLRIENGMPSWDNELSQDILPPEAGLETWAIDYHKGCYIGQEVISRLRSVGRVNRHLERLVSVEGAPEAGWLLFPENMDPAAPKSCGEITSCIWNPALEKTVALGFVRREHIAASARFTAAPDATGLSGHHCLLELRIN